MNDSTYANRHAFLHILRKDPDVSVCEPLAGPSFELLPDRTCKRKSQAYVASRNPSKVRFFVSADDGFGPKCDAYGDMDCNTPYHSTLGSRTGCRVRVLLRFAFESAAFGGTANNVYPVLLDGRDTWDIAQTASPHRPSPFALRLQASLLPTFT